MPTLFCLELSQAHPCHHATSDDGWLGVFGVVDRDPFGTSGTNASFIGYETEPFIVAEKDCHLQGKKESEGNRIGRIDSWLDGVLGESSPFLSPCWWRRWGGSQAGEVVFKHHRIVMQSCHIPYL